MSENLLFENLQRLAAFPALTSPEMQFSPQKDMSGPSNRLKLLTEELKLGQFSPQKDMSDPSNRLKLLTDELKLDPKFNNILLSYLLPYLINLNTGKKKPSDLILFPPWIYREPTDNEYVQNIIKDMLRDKKVSR